MVESVLLSIPEVARRFDVHESTVRRMLYRGELPGAFKIGRIWKVPETELEAYVERQRRECQGATSTSES